MVPPEMAKLIEQSFAADREREKKRRMETGEVEIELERASDDPPIPDPSFQQELETFGGALGAAGIVYSQRAIALDAVDAHGYPLAEFVIRTLGPPAIGVVTAAVTGWLAGRAGRKVRLKFGDVEAEARTPEEVERLLKLATEFRARIENKGGE